MDYNSHDAHKFQSLNHVLINLKMLSRLKSDQDKSCMFIYGVESRNKELFLDVLDYKEGKLLVKYLGLSLLKLTSLDCVILVDRIVAKLTSSLSYARRIQLIKFILFSIQVY